MELRQLTYFLAAAQTQNFRKAAEMCLVAQPALSRQIAALEAELGVELFKRVKQRVVLTVAGRAFAEYAGKALDQLQQGQQVLAQLQDEQHGTIEIGCVEPLTTAFLPAIFPAFHTHYPSVQLKVHVDRTDVLLKQIERGELDLALIFHPDVRPEVLAVKELFRQPLQIMVAADHPLAQAPRTAIPLAQIQSEPLFLLRKTSRLRRAVEGIFAARGMSAQPILEIESVAGLKELVKSGRGVTFMLQALLRPAEIENEIVLLPIADVQEEFTFALVYHRFASISRPARHFINMVST